MKKETLIAITLGIGTGIIIAVIIIFNTQKNSTNSNDAFIQTTITPIITFSAKKNEPLLINSPSDGSTTTASEIEIKGKAPKGSSIVFQSQSDEVVIKTKSSDFNVKFPVTIGENTINIVQYLEKTTDTRKLRVFRISK